MNTSKTCCRCKQVLPLAAFSHDKSRRDGLQNQCKACDKAWYQENKDAERERKKKWHLEHPRDRKEAKKEWYQANKEAIWKVQKKYDKERRKRERALRPAVDAAGSFVLSVAQYQSAAAHGARKALQAGRAVDASWQDIGRLYESQNNTCDYCRGPLARPELDHVIPFANGGDHIMDNLVPHLQ